MALDRSNEFEDGGDESGDLERTISPMKKQGDRLLVNQLVPYSDQENTEKDQNEKSEIIAPFDMRTDQAKVEEPDQSSFTIDLSPEKE